MRLIPKILAGLIVVLVALGSSAQLLMMGILGEYVGRVYEEVKRRPLYAVADELNRPPTRFSSENPADSGARSRQNATT